MSSSNQLATRLFGVFFCFILILMSCTSEKGDEYRKIEMEELRQRLINNKVNLVYVSYKDSLGNDLSPELRALLNQGKAMRTFYANRANEITQIRLTEYSDDLVFDEIQIRELLTSPFNSFQRIDINCEVADSLILDRFEKDQAIRSQSTRGFHEMSIMDSINQQIIISLMEQCPWPEDPQLIRAMWFIIQHADSGFMAYYYPRFKQMVRDSLLSASTMALMEDRMLMNHGYPQIYGSQIVQKSIYRLRDSANVNQLRASVGMGSIEENARRFDFEYDPN